MTNENETAEFVAPRFSEIETGYVLPPVEMDYSQATIDYYAVASLDMNPVHTRIDWCERARVFGIPETVGHGMMSMSAMASVVTRAWGPVSGNGGSVRYIDAKFTKPVPAGETVTNRGKVKQMHYIGPGKNWVTVSIEAVDTKGDVIGIAEVGYNLPD